MKHVYLFNQKRNKFKLVEKLEDDMYLEEVKEFFDAKDMADRIDAILDVKYVWNGTKMKFAHAGRELPVSWVQRSEEFIAMANAIIIMDFDNNHNLASKMMKDFWEIVCDCNAQKTANLSEDGKVLKTQEGLEIEIPNATELIREKLVEAELICPF